MGQARQLSKNKSDSLRRNGTLNPHQQAVSDQLFAGSDFFDPQDVVQVRYEMLRRVAIEGQSVQEVTRAFGFTSRQSFYAAMAAFERDGLEGLVPFKRGPKESHKITKDVLDFIRKSREDDPAIRIPELTMKVRDHFKLQIHQKSIERALVRIRQE